VTSIKLEGGLTASFAITTKGIETDNRQATTPLFRNSVAEWESTLTFGKYQGTVTLRQ
jgi:hypothetical protein